MGLSSLKILHVLDHSLPLHSGYTFRSQNILCAQQRRGWTPLAITSPKQEENRGGGTAMEEIDGIRYFRAGYGHHIGKEKLCKVGVMWVLARRLRDIARKEKPDILHAHSPVLNAFPALLVGWQLRIPVVYEIRAFWEDAAVDHGTYGEKSITYRLVRRMETFACHRAARVFVICEGLRKELQLRGIHADKISIIGNGINPEAFKKINSLPKSIDSWGLRGKRVVAFIGSFYRYEGLDLLVSAFHQLAKDRSDLVLLLAGGGEMEQELKRKVEVLGISQIVKMLGRVGHEQISEIYALADFLVYPRYSLRLTELVTPLKPLEAMAMGKALIASDIGGHRELIKHEQTGLLFEAGNESALLNSMRLLLSAPDLRAKLGDRGSEWVVQNRTWDKTIEPYARAYESAVKMFVSSRAVGAVR
jgi:PEP-CTERM/exosortase A-associated glycosyltransferase